MDFTCMLDRTKDEYMVKYSWIQDSKGVFLLDHIGFQEYLTNMHKVNNPFSLHMERVSILIQNNYKTIEYFPLWGEFSKKKKCQKSVTTSMEGMFRSSILK